jgi:tetratricopeptide (TPR) repeat protein
VAVSSRSRFAVLPDPGRATSLDELAHCLTALKLWAGNPSYETITGRVNAERPAREQVGKTTVVDCFRSGRRRLDGELVGAVVRALHPDAGYLNQWRQALRVVTGEIMAAAQVRVHDALPDDLPEFTGRAAELDRIGQAVRAGEAVVISALEGMAGVGKTRLALRIAHDLSRERGFDRVLFVDLRGFHPDPSVPPADPAAVLDGFLRLLGVPAQQVPHGLEERAAAYRDRLAGSRGLVVLDNAAHEEQILPLLPGTPGCVALVTSRRRLAGLPAATRIDVDVFTPAESLEFLATALPGTAAGDDPGAAARIAERCGHLPLALALVSGQMRAKPGWTLTDHADWLDERWLESGVELALDVSYRYLPAGESALLRSLSLHPGQDFDVYAAAALSASDPDVAGARLRDLGAYHLVQPAGPGRFALHDLVRAYAAARAADEDRRSDRQAALTRLLDYYLAAAVEAMNRMDPVDASRRPGDTASPVPLPSLAEPITWLDAERANLVAAAVFAADHDRPGHAVRFSATLFRYLVAKHHLDALTVHGRAARAAERLGDLSGRAGALANISITEVQLGRHEEALAHGELAWQIFREARDVAGQARALNTLAIIENRLGRYQDAAEHVLESLDLHRRAGNDTGQARALVNLGNVRSRMGRYEEAVDHYVEAVPHCQKAGDRTGEAVVLSNLGRIEVKLGRYDDAEAHLGRALALDRELRNTGFEASTLDNFGALYAGRGDIERAVAFHREAMALFLQVGDRYGESCAHNSLGAAALAGGRADEAIREHTAAYAIASEPGVADLEEQARAQTGLGRAHQAGGDLPAARRHLRLAVELWSELKSPEADRVSALLTTLE